MRGVCRTSNGQTISHLDLASQSGGAELLSSSLQSSVVKAMAL